MQGGENLYRVITELSNERDYFPRFKIAGI